MGVKEGNDYHENGSVFMGAIIMTNRATKLECLKRKLFGLPLSMAFFIKQIKAGMLLFLFEHEERKLYGVFEATSDGALNIIPNAYISSGRSFPAQILFRRLWMCKPLSEEEFCDAIEENYYTHNKFKFGLSYEQVFRLIHLFSLKRIRLNLHQRQERPNNIITEFEMTGRDKGQVTGEASSLEASSREHSTNDCVDLITALSRSNTNYPSYEKRFTTSQSSLGSIGPGSYRTAPPAIERHPSYTVHPTFANDPPIRSNFPAHPYDYANYQYFPRSVGEVPFVNLGRMDDPPLPQEHNTWIPSPMENNIPHSRSEIRSRHTGPNGYNYSSRNYRSSPFPVSKTSNVSLPPVGFEGHPNPQAYKHMIPERYDRLNPRHSFSTQGNTTDIGVGSLPSICDPSNAVGFEGHPNPQTYKHIIPERYDRSNPRISFSTQGNTADIGVGSLPSICDPSNAEDQPSATQSQFDFRGQQCWDLGPSSDYIPLPGDSDLDRNRLPSHLTSPQTDLSGSSYSESVEDDDYDELRPYPPTHASQHRIAGINSKLHSDAEQGRTSVFSRLSKASERRNKRESREQDGVTLDQLVKLLSQRREERIKAHDQSTICDDDKQSESIVMTESNEASLLDEMLNSSCDAVDEESIEVPFMNFKRRSEIRRIVSEMETNAYVGSENEEALWKNKRRKLVRPSLNDECQNCHGTSAESVEAHPLVEAEEKIAEESESSPDPNPGHLASCITEGEKINETDEFLLTEKSESSPIPNPGYLTSSIIDGEKIIEEGELVASEKGESSPEHPGYLSSTTKKVTDASGDRLHVSNRNLLWFLQKTT